MADIKLQCDCGNRWVAKGVSETVAKEFSEAFQILQDNIGAGFHTASTGATPDSAKTKTETYREALAEIAALGEVPDDGPERVSREEFAQTATAIANGALAEALKEEPPDRTADEPGARKEEHNPETVAEIPPDAQGESFGGLK
jgi:hypothetical protein